MDSLRSRGLPTAVVAASVTLTLTALAGCGPGDPDSGRTSSSSAVATSPTTSPSLNVYEAQRAEGVSTLLDALTEGVLSGNAAAVSRLFDAAADPALRDRFVSAAADRSSSTPDRRGGVVRFAEFSYQLAPTEEAEQLVPSGLQQRLDAAGSSDSWVAPVELRYALGGGRTPGVDEPEVVIGSQFVVARYGDDWRLVADTAALDRPAMPVQMWEFDGLRVADVATAGGISVVASYPGTAETATSLWRMVPSAVDAVTDFWGDGWDRRAVIVTTASPPQFEALVAGGESAVGTAAAATVYSRVDHPRRTAVGQRVVLTPAARGLPAPALAVVLRHELLHVAARVDTARDAPLWLTEGVAEYVARKNTYRRVPDAAPDLYAAIRSGSVPGDLPSDTDFGMDGPTSKVAYQSAWSFAAYLAQRFGDERLRRVYLGVAASGSEERRHDAVLRSVLGASRTELIADWRRWLTEQDR